MLSDALEDPLARFRTSMGASSTEYPGHRSGPPSTSPDRHNVGLDVDHDEEGSQLLRLIDEATHAVADDHDGCPQAGASFMVTASASHSSFTQPGALGVPSSSITSNLYGPPPGYPATVSAPPPPSNSPPPPSFAEAIAALSSPVPSVAQPPHLGSSPTPFGPAAGGSSAAPPPPPLAAGAGGGAVEPMIVRNQRGVFLLHPVSRVGAGAGAAVTQTTQAHSHTGTPVVYASPAPSSSSFAHPNGSSPPASPLPTYALPPPMPFLTHSLHSHHHGTAGAAVAAAPPHHHHHPHHGVSAYVPHVGVTPSKKSPASHHGASPPNYPAPPPYRSPVAKHSALGM